MKPILWLTMYCLMFYCNRSRRILFLRALQARLPRAPRRRYRGRAFSLAFSFALGETSASVGEGQMMTLRARAQAQRDQAGRQIRGALNPILTVRTGYPSCHSSHQLDGLLTCSRKA